MKWNFGGNQNLLWTWVKLTKLSMQKRRGEERRGTLRNVEVFCFTISKLKCFLSLVSKWNILLSFYPLTLFFKKWFTLSFVKQKDLIIPKLKQAVLFPVKQNILDWSKTIFFHKKKICLGSSQAIPPLPDFWHEHQTESSRFLPVLVKIWLLGVRRIIIVVSKQRHE